MARSASVLPAGRHGNGALRGCNPLADHAPAVQNTHIRETHDGLTAKASPASLRGLAVETINMKLNIITLVIVVVAAVVFAVYAHAMPWTPAHIAGVAIALPGLLLLVVARLQLGRAFSVQAKASILVTTGLYSRIRNPIYIFGGLMILGVIVFAGQPWFLLAFAVLIPLQIYRGRKESQVLEEKFGEEYRAYRRRTWF